MSEDRLSGPFLHKILAFVDPPDLYRCMRVSHGFYETIKRNINQLPRFRADISLETRCSKNKYELTINCCIHNKGGGPPKIISIEFDDRTMHICETHRQLFTEACRSRLVSNNGCLPKLSSVLSSVFWRCRNWILSIVGRKIRDDNSIPINDALASFRKILGVTSLADDKCGYEFLSVIRDVARSHRLDLKRLAFFVPSRMWNMCMRVLYAFDNRKLRSYSFKIAKSPNLESICSVTMLPYKWLWLNTDGATFDGHGFMEEILNDWLLGAQDFLGISLINVFESDTEILRQFIYGLPLIEIIENDDNHPQMDCATIPPRTIPPPPVLGQFPPKPKPSFPKPKPFFRGELSGYQQMKGSFGRNIDDRRIWFEIQEYAWILGSVAETYEEDYKSMMLQDRDY